MIGYFPLTTIVSLTVVQCTLSIDVTKPSHFQATIVPALDIGEDKCWLNFYLYNTLDHEAQMVGKFQSA
jgi:hypothetical protein